ncbi:Ppx/GppA family phosphatase [Polymorphum gilvum]|uniref:Ppx/GppA phosphatase family n=1 Tax=Polymorphum gilvum (strain LMG 25793 / CGMCC 1.9160 / SL003B-26A1) TaxID=991905 RepID=F2J1K3_POLGS|nr:Ppx/GppA phosphatase family protein [Polymorphum gilvum]ADZ70804.1 Ppx/GppA phosphatase family [Polymorphum gilvum SL003B-26A1]
MDDAHAKHAPARGRLNGTGPVAVIDIGSNSVRLVVYERQSRTPTVLFNEKVLAGLGRGLVSTGRLAQDSIGAALAALHRFRCLCDHIGVQSVHVLATAAARDATNGGQFVAEVERLTGVPVRILNGHEEAYYSALGIVSGFWKPQGVVGDLGGGSLELVDVGPKGVGRGQTFPLGGLRLQEASGGKMVRAQKIADDCMEKAVWPSAAERQTFYAVGGTWRSLARLHLFQAGYPLHVMHHYAIPAGEAIEFCRVVAQRDINSLDFIEAISKQRRALLPYGAVVLERVLRAMNAERLVMSATGVREGLLYEMLPEELKAQDPLLEAARELSLLRARSPEHAEELVQWTDRLFPVIGLEETEEERRLRRAACLLSDIGWRAHPDYRGEQSLNIISNAGFIGLDHPGRAYLAMSVFYRHAGLIDDALSPRLRELAPTRLKERARILGAALRVASLVSASMAGVLLETSFVLDEDTLILKLPARHAHMDGERLRKRVGQFAKLIGAKGIVLPLP